MVHFYNPSTQKAKAGGLWVWGQPWLHSELKPIWIFISEILQWIQTSKRGEHRNFSDTNTSWRLELELPLATSGSPPHPRSWKIICKPLSETKREKRKKERKGQFPFLVNDLWNHRTLPWKNPEMSSYAHVFFPTVPLAPWVPWGTLLIWKQSALPPAGAKGQSHASRAQPFDLSSFVL
jgi:hypothetical protein